MKVPDDYLKHINMRGLALLGLLAGLLLIPAMQQALNDTDSIPASPDSSVQRLKEQVETSDGTPRDGYDPASQPQASLAAAASSQTATGSSPQPAAGVQGAHSRHAPEDVYSNTESSGIGANGCYIDYGVQGQQCLPAHAAGPEGLTCQGVRQHFRNGIQVTGSDRFQLDTNQDGTACDGGDA